MSLKLMSSGKQPEGKSNAEKGKTVAEQSKKARTTTIQTTPTKQVSEPPSDVFTSALVVITQMTAWMTGAGLGLNAF